MEHQCSGVILAGGLNTRFSGKKKALEIIGGKAILSYTYDLFREMFEEVILITNDPMEFLSFDVKMAADIYQVRSSLTGIHAGLSMASNRWAFFAACDTPFIKKQLVETVASPSKIHLCLVERSGGVQTRVEPLPAEQLWPRLMANTVYWDEPARLAHHIDAVQALLPVAGLHRLQLGTNVAGLESTLDRL